MNIKRIVREASKNVAKGAGVSLDAAERIIWEAIMETIQDPVVNQDPDRRFQGAYLNNLRRRVQTLRAN
jgi:hypothetical protein